ncbi:hypothetical protein J4E91_010919 [Alternaria rosae]|nr:hypothetical protein J4E91_010919 [Alternaria rosae]
MNTIKQKLEIAEILVPSTTSNHLTTKATETEIGSDDDDDYEIENLDKAQSGEHFNSVLTADTLELGYIDLIDRVCHELERNHPLIRVVRIAELEYLGWFHNKTSILARLASKEEIASGKLLLTGIASAYHDLGSGLCIQPVGLITMMLG